MLTMNDARNERMNGSLEEEFARLVSEDKYGGHAGRRSYPIALRRAPFGFAKISIVVGFALVGAVFGYFMFHLLLPAPLSATAVFGAVAISFGGFGAVRMGKKYGASAGIAAVGIPFVALVAIGNFVPVAGFAELVAGFAMTFAALGFFMIRPIMRAVVDGSRRAQENVLAACGALAVTFGLLLIMLKCYGDANMAFSGAVFKNAHEISRASGQLESTDVNPWPEILKDIKERKDEKDYGISRSRENRKMRSKTEAITEGLQKMFPSFENDESAATNANQDSPIVRQ